MTIQQIFEAMIEQLKISDQAAAEANQSKVPSMWQIHNSHLREMAEEGLAITVQAKKLNKDLVSRLRRG